MAKKPDSVFVALVNSEDEILTVRRSSSVNNAGLWALPGGRQDPDETVLTTGQREVFEEIGLLIDKMVSGHGHLHVVSNKTHVVVVPWTPTKEQVEISTHLVNGRMASTEIDAVKWRTWTEISGLTGLHKSLDLLFNKWPGHSVRVFDMLENRSLL